MQKVVVRPTSTHQKFFYKFGATATCFQAWSNFFSSFHSVCLMKTTFLQLQLQLWFWVLWLSPSLQKNAIVTSGFGRVLWRRKVVCFYFYSLLCKRPTKQEDLCTTKWAQLLVHPATAVFFAESSMSFIIKKKYTGKQYKLDLLNAK